MTTELQTIERKSSNVTPHELLRFAIDNNADIGQLERLMDLQDRYDANQARKAFVEDMTAFKLAAPEIIKRKQVSFGSGDKKTEYKHATLFDVCEAIVADLAKHGFTHRWKTDQLDGGQIVVTCVITHKLGHSEETPLRSSADQSGGKNNIQAVASTLSYLQRYSLLAATGLATKDMDDDGQAAGPGVAVVSAEQCKTLTDLIDSTATDKAKFCEHYKIESVDKLTAIQYLPALSMLKKKVK